MTTSDPDDDLSILPERYAAALRLARDGASPTHIADDLGIPVESVAVLLVLAEAKLGTAIRRRAEASPPHSHPRGGDPHARHRTAGTDNFPET